MMVVMVLVVSAQHMFVKKKKKNLRQNLADRYHIVVGPCFALCRPCPSPAGILLGRGRATDITFVSLVP